MAAMHPYHAAVFQRFYLLCAGLKGTTMPAADFIRADGDARICMYQDYVMPLLFDSEYPKLNSSELDLVFDRVKKSLFESHDKELARKAKPSASSSPSFG